MYLSRIEIENYKGIKNLNIDFSPDINIIIGENGKNKTALIDAIRLLYNLGKPKKDITISDYDFFVDVENGKVETNIEISYFFKDLSEAQKGAYFEYLVFGENPEDTYATIVIKYEMRDNKFPYFSYSTGIGEEQRADYHTFELFQHYYLGALRDSTRDLLNSRNNILGNVIKQTVIENETEEKYTKIIETANNDLLAQPEVQNTRNNINTKLLEINSFLQNEKIGLQISETNITYILNAIKPFLPFDKKTLIGNGFNLNQNSLGYNNMIYIATVLSDINERIKDDKLSHFALLIEEPEAHLHPQLQLNLYNFLKQTNTDKNSQLFITSHSPTLTSRVKFDNLIVIDNSAYKIFDCFTNRESEKIIENTKKGVELKEKDFLQRKKQLERYIDVTKSQLFFAKGVLLVEGISEELLIPAFCNVLGFNIDDYQIELINVKGTSFYPFIHLFNSNDKSKRLNKKIAILTDEDQFTNSKKSKYSFKNLVKDEFNLLDELYNEIKEASVNTRIPNLFSTKNNIDNIIIKSGEKTFEFQIALNNINVNYKSFDKNFLVKYLMRKNKKKIKLINTYFDKITIDDNNLSSEQQYKTALLLWKIINSKAEFAQDFSLYIIDNLEDAKKSLNIPVYISEAFEHLIN